MSPHDRFYLSRQRHAELPDNWRHHTHNHWRSLRCFQLVNLGSNQRPALCHLQVHWSANSLLSNCFTLRSRRDWHSVHTRCWRWHHQERGCDRRYTVLAWQTAAQLRWCVERDIHCSSLVLVTHSSDSDFHHRLLADVTCLSEHPAVPACWCAIFASSS